MKTLVIFLLLTTPTYAAGHAFNENFSVLVEANPSQEAAQQIAEQVLERADRLRKQIALEWLGAELPRSEGRAAITIHYQPGRESALTWAKDHTNRTLHDVYLRTKPGRVQQAIDEMLPHEIAHVVLATRYPEIPAWINEGIASQYDDEGRKAIRRKLVRRWEETNSWPNVSRILEAQTLHANDHTGYAIASSLVEFLAMKHGKIQLLGLDWSNDPKITPWQGR